MKTLEIEKKLKNAIKISIMNRYSEVEPILFDILKDLNQLNSQNNENIVLSENRIKLSCGTADAMYRVAYWLSKNDHEALYPYLSQSQAIQRIADLLNVKVTTLRNTRDYYDRFIVDKKSNRKGWDIPKLPPKLEAIFYEYSAKTDSEIFLEISKILNIDN